MVEKVGLPTFVAAIEALAAVRALIFAQKIDLSSIILEGYSKIIINKLKSNDASLLLFNSHKIWDREIVLLITLLDILTEF